jgi:hypothetical protein
VFKDGLFHFLLGYRNQSFTVLCPFLSRDPFLPIALPYCFHSVLKEKDAVIKRPQRVHGFFKSLSSIFISSVNLLQHNGTGHFYCKLISNRLTKDTL